MAQPRLSRHFTLSCGLAWLGLFVFTLLIGSSNAVTCDSHTDKATCNVSVDGAVKCMWDEAGEKCINSEERIGDGMVGTTAVESDTMTGMSPDLSAEGVRGVLDALSLNSTFCDLPPDETSRTGISCAAYMPMWWYNSTSGMCEEYIYGGCSKTENLFDFEAVCKAAAAEYCEPVNGTAQAPNADTVVETDTEVPVASAASGPAQGSQAGAPGSGVMRLGVGIGLLCTFLAL